MPKNVKRSQNETGGNDSPKTVNLQPTKEIETMSTQPTAEPKKPETKKIDKTFKGFDLDNLGAGLKEIEIKGIEFTPAATTAEAYDRIGKDDSIVLEALNAVLEKQTISAAKKSKIPAGFASKKVVLDFIKSFRVSPTFASMIVGEKGQKDWKPSYDKQTDAILSQAAQVPFILDNLKATAAAAPDSDDDSE